MPQNTSEQFVSTLEQMPIQDVRSQFGALFAEALAIEDAEKQTSAQESSNETPSTK